MHRLQDISRKSTLNQWPNTGEKGLEELCSGIALCYQVVMMMMYEQNKSLNNPVHFTLQLFPCACGCHLASPANGDNPCRNLMPKHRGCSDQEHRVPADPVGSATARSSAAQLRDAAQTSDGCCAPCRGIDFCCLQERCTKAFSTERWATLEECEPDTSGNSFLQLPRARCALWRRRLTRHHCRSKGNAKTSHLLISQQLESLERWQLSRDSVHFAPDPASHLNPRPRNRTSSVFICHSS